MKQIERTVVASGVIGQYNHEWTIQMLHDNKYNSKCYNLYINKEYIDYYPSVVKALEVLVRIFEE